MLIVVDNGKAKTGEVKKENIKPDFRGTRDWKDVGFLIL